MENNPHDITFMALGKTWRFTIDNPRELADINNFVDTNITLPPDACEPVNIIELRRGEITNPRPHLKEHPDHTELFGVNFFAKVFKPNQADSKRAFVKYAPNAGQDAALSVLRFLLMREVYTTNGLLLHGSSVKTDAGIFVFAGKSGAGKSTARGKFPPQDRLDDDLVLLTKESGNWARSPIPSFGEIAPFAETPNPNLRAIFFPERGRFELSSMRGATAILKCLHIPWKTKHKSIEDDTTLLERALNRAADLASSVEIYQLNWELDDDIAQKITEALSNKM